MYDPLEISLSFEYMKKLTELCKNLDFAVMGGWGVYFHVNDEYRKAFGTEYLKSRDIDIFIDGKDINKFNKIITNLGFIKSSYFFRYELIYGKNENRILNQEEAKKKPIFDLIYIFLDVFSNSKIAKDAWIIEELKNVKIKMIDDIPVLDKNILLEMKCHSFFEREKLDKEYKDACDIYALLMYGNTKLKTDKEKKAVEKILSREDLCTFIAEHVLKDALKENIVKMSVRNLLKPSYHFQ